MRDSLSQNPETAVALPMTPLEGAHGEFDPNETLVPRLNIVHGVGDLVDSFAQGSVVYNRETELQQPLKLTIFGYKKFWIQNIKFNKEVKPVKYYSLEDVVKSGGNVNDKVKEDEDPNNFRPGLDTLLAIELPIEQADLPGSIDFEDKFYARALWVIQKTTYNNVIRQLNFVNLGLDKRGLSIASQSWTMRVERKQLTNNKVYLPKLTAGNLHKPEFVEFLRAIFS